MTVFLTPDGRPFFGGTYFPQAAAATCSASPSCCRAIDDVWRDRRDRAASTRPAELTEAIGRGRRSSPAGDDARRAPSSSTPRLDASWPSLRPGVGRLRRGPEVPPDDEPRAAAAGPRRTRPADDALPDGRPRRSTPWPSGGIYDHLGGGFARYSIDERWLVPHFEKMLYDQALLARVYLHAWQVTGEARYRQVVDETIAYVLRDLRHADGGFYSAEDADCPRGRGGQVLRLDARTRCAPCSAATPADAAIEWYGVTAGRQLRGRATSCTARCGATSIRPPDVEAGPRARCSTPASSGPGPGLDDKVLTEWNGLMLATLAEAAAATGNADWLAAAVARPPSSCSADLRATRRPLAAVVAGRRPRRRAPGRAQHLAYAADHGALLDAFTRLAEATGEARWIAEARRVADDLLDLFWDDEQGGLFTTGERRRGARDPPEGPARQRHAVGQLLAAVGLLRLGGPHRRRPRYQPTGPTAILRLLSGPAAAATRSAFAHLLGRRRPRGAAAPPRSPSSATGPTSSRPCTRATCPTPCWPGASPTRRPCGTTATPGPTAGPGLRVPQLRLPAPGDDARRPGRAAQRLTSARWRLRPESMTACSSGGRIARVAMHPRGGG